MGDPYLKSLPSVFVVASPFQILCAKAAIKQLEIDIYDFYVYLSKDNFRNDQVKRILNSLGISYKIIPDLKKLYFWRSVINACFHKHNIYNRLFIGDFRSVSLFYVGLGLISDNSNVVYLDDGNITISILNGNNSASWAKKHQYLLRWISRMRKIDYGRNFLTIFSDISNSKYKIRQLLLEKIVDNGQRLGNSPKDIFIIGTCVDSYCKPLDIPEEIYIKKLEELIVKLRQQYPDDNIYFIPHGREYKNYSQRLCEQYGCIFKRPQMMVELELINMHHPPKVICGYTSTALFTLKKMFPATKVVNILFELSLNNPFYKDYVITSEYYLQNGIEWINEPLS